MVVTIGIIGGKARKLDTASPDFPQLSHEDALTCLAALPQGATAVLLGGTDTGKTSFVWEAAAACIRSGRSVAVVDCDLGQSEIGPPGTVGVALATPGQAEALRSLRDLPLLAAYFVGAVTPARHTLDVCVGACQMARVARKSRPSLTLVDTCGWVEGGAARHFKHRLTELILPQLVLTFTHSADPDPLLDSFQHLKVPDVCRIAVSDAARRKTPAARATRRAARFLAVFDGAREIAVSWDDAAMLGTNLGLGAPLPHHTQQFLSRSLHLPVLHAERIGSGGVYIVVNGERWDTDGLAAIEGHFHTGAISIVPAQKFAGLLLGLINSQGAFLDLGLLSRIDFTHRILTIRTACRRPAAIAQVWFGSLRLHPDGREKGENRPGEI